MNSYVPRKSTKRTIANYHLTHTMKNYEKIEIDKGEKKLLEFKWVTSDELRNIDLRPINIRDMLINKENIKTLTHIVKREEK